MILWILEKPGEPGPTLIQAFQGRHPIQAIGSFESLKTLLILSPNQNPPDALIVHLDLDAKKEAELRKIWLKTFAHSPLIMIGKDFSIKALDSVKSINELENAISMHKSFKGLSLSLAEQALYFEGQRLQYLSPKELRLLSLFLAHPGALLTKDFIKAHVWGPIKQSPRTLAVNISRLRRALEGTGVDLISDYGNGYKLV